MSIVGKSTQLYSRNFDVNSVQTTIAAVSIPTPSHWYDATSPGNFSFIAGTAISQWSNVPKTSNITAPNYPTYVSNVVGTYGAVRFNGTTNYFNSNPMFRGNSPATFFIVWRPGVINANTQTLIWATGDTNGASRSEISVNNGRVTYTKISVAGSNGGTSQGSYLPASNTTDRLIHTFVINSSSFASIFVNGQYTRGILSDASGVGITSEIHESIGARLTGSTTTPTVNQHFNGDIYEMRHYSNKAFTDIERKIVEDELASKWQITLRRGSNNPFVFGIPLRDPSPLDMLNCTYWFDAADINTITLSGTNVTAWSDKARLITFSNGVSPTYVSNQYQTKGVVRFNGTNQFLTSLGTPIDISGTRFELPYSVIFLNRYSSTSGGTRTLISSNDTTTNTSNYWAIGNSNSLLMSRRFPGLTNYTSTTTQTVTTNTNYIQSFVYTTSAVTIRLNGTTTSVTNATSAGPIQRYTNGRMTLGARQGAASTLQEYFAGDLAELLFFKRALSASECQFVEGYLAHKWGIVTTLNAANPFRSVKPQMIPWTPSNSSNMFYWCDMADSSGIDFSGNTTFVSNWRNKTRWGRTFDGYTNKPSYISNAYNSFPTLRFNGTNTFLDIALTRSQYDFAFSNFGRSSFAPMTIVVVCKPSNTTGIQSLFGFNGFSSSYIWTYLSLSNGLPQIRQRTSSGATSTATSSQILSTSALSIVSYDITFPNSTTSLGYIYVNGTLTTLVSGVSLTVADQYFFGVCDIGKGITSGGTNTNFFNGDICEIAGTYSTTLTNLERRQLEGYLAQKWGLVANLPTNHIGRTDDFF